MFEKIRVGSKIKFLRNHSLYDTGTCRVNQILNCFNQDGNCFGCPGQIYVSDEDNVPIDYHCFLTRGDRGYVPTIELLASIKEQRIKNLTEV